MSARCCVIAAALGLAIAPLAVAETPDDRFRAANDLARGGDYPKAAAAYAALAASGAESASLYWNWAQGARARGALGEALWALLRAREIEPADAAVGRALQEVSAELKLDAAEMAPEPLASVARFARRLHLDALTLVIAAASMVLHALARFRLRYRTVPLAWSAAGLALLLALPSLAGAWARPTGVVVRRGAMLLEAASPTATATGTLREGEVLPILAESGGYVRVEDSSGARGWAHVNDVRPLDRPPSPAEPSPTESSR